MKERKCTTTQVCSNTIWWAATG